MWFNHIKAAQNYSNFILFVKAYIKVSAGIYAYRYTTAVQAPFNMVFAPFAVEVAYA